MLKSTSIAVALSAMLSLSACVTNQGEKQTLGTLIGAGLGGLAGSQIGSGTGQLAAIGAGVLLGGLLGSEVGRSLDKADEAYLANNAQSTLETAPTGASSSWVNPDSGNSGSLTPTHTYATASGQPCREYHSTVTIDGQTEDVYGTACREPDGSWRFVN
ncbi:MAG: RT0821/Lpp0805 family surface protein [Alphaproteobacteria bacterium]